MYYTLNTRTDKEVGNVYPQVSCNSLELAHSITFDEFAYFDSELLFELAPKAKLTDILSQAAISAYGLLVNKKVKEVLEEFNLMEHRYYKCIIKDRKGNLHDYYWLHLVDYSFLHKIDYENSKFYTREYGFREGDITLQSYNDYKEKKENLGKMWSIGSDLIKLNNNFDTSLDLFNIPLFGTAIYASDLLAAKMHNYTTGLLINKTDLVIR